MKNNLPWQGWIAAKIIFSRLPISYRVWQRLGLLKHGQMEQPDYAYRVWKDHSEAIKIQRSARLTVLELGPGDTLFSAMISYAYGVTGSYLVDVGPFARYDLRLYNSMANYLLKKGLFVPEMANLSSIDEFLATYGAQYLTSGLSSLRTIPDQSIDFIWSHGVLEHIRKVEFIDTMHELRRIIRNDGILSHTIDYRDHIGGALNHLRFSDHIWESDFFADSGFYTNRIRFFDMLNLFQEASFDTEIISVNRWDSVPTPRPKLNTDFENCSDLELNTWWAKVLLRPK